ncbi:hypothetical protein U9M48_022714 [Paspalum notatum var. saurae]|uniref:Uncharacterized protein n=1 Tax=Paspalum notatum var. saurae TaxID=547442 RepID=A0AAQ3WUZ9_PASNO
MGNNETCMKSHEKPEIGMRGDKVSYSPEEGEFRKDEPFGLGNLVHKGMVASVIKFGSSPQVAVEKAKVTTLQSTSPERGSHEGGIANTATIQSPVNARESTFHGKYSEKHRNSSSSHIKSKERREKRLQNCYSYHDYRHVLKKIEKVYPERIGKLLLHQNKDRKEFNVLLKKQEFEFFQEHACSYRAHFEHVVPTARYRRMKLPKLYFCMLCKVFRKHMQSQIIKFVKQQINDRNKEKRIKERWIFEATAGYLKKYFDETSLTYSGFEMEKSKWDVNTFSEAERDLKFLDMQSLNNEIEAIASAREVEETHTDKESVIVQPEPTIENLQSPVETNGGAEHGLSVDSAGQIAIVDSMSSLSNSAPTMELSENVETQVAFSSPPQNEGENVERSCSLVVIDGTLAVAKAVSADLENAPPVFRKKQKCMSPGDDASEGSCSRSQRKFPLETDSNVHETTLHDEESQAERLPSVNANQMEQADVAASKEVSSGDTSSFGQVTEQQSTTATTSTLVEPSTQLLHYDPTCQSVAHLHQSSTVNISSISTGLDSRGELNVQQQSANQTTTNSMVEHMPESELQSDPVIAEFSQILLYLSDHTSSSVQVTEQHISSNASALTQQVGQLHGDQTSQTAAHQHEPSGRNNCSVQAWLESPRSSNVQWQSNSQTTTDSSSGQYILESGHQSDPLKIEMTRLLKLHDLMTRRHLTKRQKIILEREIEMAECKRKYNEQFQKLEIETLQKQREFEILQDKICKQQILAETFQALHGASTEVASSSQRGAPRTTTRVPNQPSAQQVWRFPVSATMSQPPQTSAELSTNNFIRQPFMATPQAIANTLARPATNFMHAPSGVMGAGTYHALPPHVQAFVNLLPASRGAAASFDR